MKKKGFTLLELLAVIVILGIFSIISVPVIMNIIKSNRQRALIKTYESIEKVAAEYIMNEKSGLVSGEEIVPMNNLMKYISNPPSNSSSEYVLVKKNGNDIFYYYSGRDKDQSVKTELLKDKINNLPTSSLVKNLIVNGRPVNKVIGQKNNKNSVKNHVWYSGFLWQVLETNSQGIKMVLQHGIVNLSYGTTANYKNSYVRKWLTDVSGDNVNYPSDNDGVNTGIFYNSLSRRDLLVDTEMCLDLPTNVVEENVTTNLYSTTTQLRLKTFTKISNCTNKIVDKVGTMTLEDYVLSYDGTLNEFSHTASNIPDAGENKKGGSMGYNFIDIDERTWTVQANETNNFIWSITQYNPGLISKAGSASNTGKIVRPVITLKDSVQVISGDGTYTSPYMLKENYTIPVNNKLNNATSGEYVYMNESNNPYTANTTKVPYRIVKIDQNGIKLIRDNVLSGLPNTIAYSSNTVPFYSYKETGVSNTLWCIIDGTTYLGGCSGFNVMRDIGSGPYALGNGQSLGYFFNKAPNSFYNWFNDEYKNYIKETDWTLRATNGISDPTKYLLIDEENNNGLTYPGSDYDGTYKGKIALIDYGELFAGNDRNIRYWFLARSINGTTNKINSNETGGYEATTINYNYSYLRPVLYLNHSVVIKGGNGTQQNPYQIGI